MTNADDKGRKPYEKVYRGGRRRNRADDELAGLRPGRERRPDADRREAGTGAGGRRFDWGVPRDGRADTKQRPYRRYQMTRGTLEAE